MEVSLPGSNHPTKPSPLILIVKVAQLFLVNSIVLSTSSSSEPSLYLTVWIISTVGLTQDFRERKGVVTRVSQMSTQSNIAEKAAFSCSFYGRVS